MSDKQSVLDIKWDVPQDTPKRKGADSILDYLLKKRGIKTKKKKKEFFDPKSPESIDLRSTGIKPSQVDKAIKRIKKAKTNKESVIVYGDYDADGVCATAIAWESLYKLGVDALPFIPDRFEEGYGINAETIEKLKKKNKNLSLIVTVDNGIVANEAVKKANKLGIDVIITDHHQKEQTTPDAVSIIHTTEITGAGIAWFLARELFDSVDKKISEDLLEIAAIGTVADQAKLLGVNRSLVKYGLEKLNGTKRPGLLELYKEAAVKKGNIGVYTIGFIIAPRINATGRMEHAIDSLRLLCTNDVKKAEALAAKLGRINYKRQRQVESVSLHAREVVERGKIDKAILVSHSSYHEGVIGLVASNLVEKYYRPSIVFSEGDEFSKASARSITGFNMIEAIRQLDELIEGGGGHPMAAGFTIKTEKISDFVEKFTKIAGDLVSDKLLQKSLRIDLDIGFDEIDGGLLKKLNRFEPTGIGNPTPVFFADDVSVLSVRAVGKDKSHLKMKLEKNDKIMDAIAFGFGKYYSSINSSKQIDAAFSLDENIWQGVRSIQLKIKDVRAKNE